MHRMRNGTPPPSDVSPAVAEAEPNEVLAVSSERADDIDEWQVIDQVLKSELARGRQAELQQRVETMRKSIETKRRNKPVEIDPLGKDVSAHGGPLEERGESGAESLAAKLVEALTKSQEQLQGELQKWKSKAAKLQKENKLQEASCES
eukprot:Skav224919  [mRNA]  locus=scaffold1966:67505:74624:+ [translate_table: standard]